MKKGSKKPGTRKQTKKAQAKKGKAAPAKKKEPKARKEKAPAVDLDALRKPVEEAKAALTAAEVEASTLEAQAKETRSKAKDAFRDALAPYRDACRAAGIVCEFGGTKAGPVAPRVRFLVEKVKTGVKVTIKGRPETAQVLSFETLKESVGKAALAYCESVLGPVSEQGAKHAGLGNRLRAILTEN